MKASASVAVLALLSLSAITGCAGSAQPPEPRHLVPTDIVPIALVDFDVVSFVDVDLHTAVQTREAVESEFGKAYGQAGHPRWFFRAFDHDNLDFVVARYEPNDAHASRYVAQRRLRVKRTSEAERALGVSEVVREYEIGGARGVRAGMTRKEAERLLGRPDHQAQMTSPRTVEARYASACIEFVDDRVAHTWVRDVCAR